MKCISVPDGYVLEGERSPLKRLLRWLSWTFTAIAVACIGIAVWQAIDARNIDSRCDSLSRSRRVACRADESDAEALAAIFAFVGLGFVFWAIVFGVLCWLAREYRAYIRPATPEGEDT